MSLNRADIMNPLVFYSSREWRELRYETLRLNALHHAHSGGPQCRMCGRTQWGDGVKLHVDHIKPRILYPELALSPNNLQVLCSDCNAGKSWRWHDDWRRLPRVANDRQMSLPFSGHDDAA